MNKIKRIAILFLIISTIFNFIYSVKASGVLVGTNNIINIKKTKAEIIELKQKIDNLKKNKEKLGDYSQAIINISADVDNYLKDAENNSEKTTSIPAQKWTFITSLITVIEEKQNSGESFSNTQTSSESETNTTTVANDFEDSYYIPQSIQKVNNGIYLVDARHNYDGKAGDGGGDEVFIGLRENDKKLYKVYRATDMKLQRTMAFLAADMSNNDNIGYVYGADTVREYFRKHNYNPSEVIEKCDTDCSSFVSMAMEGAFAKSGKNTKVERLTTESMPKNLKQYGFNVVNEMGEKTISGFYKTGQLQIGDILVTVTPHHTAIFLGPYYTSGKIAPSSSGAYGNGTSGGYTAEGEEIDDKQNIDEKSFRFSGLPGDVTYEGELTPIRNFFAKIGDFIDYLLGLIFLVIKIIIIGFVNIAYNIFLSIVSLMKK
ncbi:MAG: hypothetical protein HG453_004040 [Clostridiales bacterium]|nr:hypothetical protein [Clostridiales bacterium]